MIISMGTNRFPCFFIRSNKIHIPKIRYAYEYLWFVKSKFRTASKSLKDRCINPVACSVLIIAAIKRDAVRSSLEIINDAVKIIMRELSNMKAKRYIITLILIGCAYIGYQLYSAESKNVNTKKPVVIPKKQVDLSTSPDVGSSGASMSDQLSLQIPGKNESNSSPSNHDSPPSRIRTTTKNSEQPENPFLEAIKKMQKERQSSINNSKTVDKSAENPFKELLEKKK